ncbi:hypothetical protein HPB49_010746 [Dermacentor silvarum]|uniref:Uncharacterized protein n=1 Tax=Dermacentor silvarum TaxID=543639 RepID=A0ACB8DZB1_DERSI|nr:hypothetical protein HPB49_010746 [Dermacentor silvarum]
MKEWAKQFRLGRESIKDEPSSGRPVEVITERIVSLVEDKVLNHRRLKLKEIATRVGLAVKTVFRIIYEKLHIAKASARWVPWHCAYTGFTVDFPVWDILPLLCKLRTVVGEISHAEAENILNSALFDYELKSM